MLSKYTRNKTILFCIGTVVAGRTFVILKLKSLNKGNHGEMTMNISPLDMQLTPQQLHNMKVDARKTCITKELVTNLFIFIQKWFRQP